MNNVTTGTDVMHQFSQSNVAIFGRGRSVSQDILLNCVQMNQTHSNHVELVEVPGLVNADAIITEVPHLWLQVKTADCLPILMQTNRDCAVIHAGREGTVNRIAEKEAKIMMDRDPSGCHCWFGPAICVMCYEIDRDTASHYDLIEENMRQVQSMYPNMSIECSGDCTLCGTQTYFSFRGGDDSDRNFFYIQKNRH